MNTSVAEPPTPEARKDLFAAWRKVVDKELQGAPFDKKLVSTLTEGLRVQPLYGPASQTTDLSRAERRGLNRPEISTWAVAQTIRAESPEPWNAALLDALKKGQNAVAMVGCGLVSDVASAEACLKGVTVEAVPLYFSSRTHVAPMAAAVVGALQKRSARLEEIRGSIGGDPLASWLEQGELPVSLARLWDERAAWTKWAKTYMPKVATIEIDTSVVSEAGGHAAQELAYALASARVVFKEMADRQVPAAQVAERIRFVFSNGPDFFVEVAKLRALRELWVQLLAPLGISAVYPRVHVRTALWNKSKLDLETNLLRTTTEALSAVLGGVESLEIGQYDEAAPLGTDAPVRLARNLHTLLGEEFQVDGPLDPAGGSWYLEELTTELAKKAWSLFQQTEAAGGLVAQITRGEWQAQVKATAKERADATDKRRAIWIGVNQFPNLKDKFTALAAEKATGGNGAVKVDAPLRAFEDTLQAAAAGATIRQMALRWRFGAEVETKIVSLPEYRNAAGFEALRARVASRTSRPKVFLAKIGPALQHKARADFSTGFFASGGFEILGKESFGTAAEAGAAALKSGAAVCVLCSTDDTYATLVPEIAAVLKATPEAPALIVAGYPTEIIETLKSQGVYEFIHIRANVRATLENVLNMIEAKEMKK